MLRALCLAPTLLVLTAANASAADRPDPGTNAALLYWQAFAQLPKLTDTEGAKLGADCLTMPLDEHARGLVTKSAYALRMMHRAAALQRCDWAVPWEDEGIEALLPQLNAARALSAVACLRARIHFDEGRPADAIDDILAARAMGRHVSRDGSAIAVLVGFSIDARTGDAIALNLPRLNTGMVTGLTAKLDAMPPMGTMAAAMLLCEKATLGWFIRKVQTAKDEDALVAFLGMTGDPKRPDTENGGAFLKACGGTAAGVVRLAEETRSSYDRMAKAMELPLDQFEKAAETELRKQAGNPVFMTLFPAVAKVRQSQARAETRGAMLSGALAVRLDGRDALAKHPDPVSGAPFEYVPYERGFELRSKPLTKDDKPLVLTVGSRAK
jgi:hypothetical protein